MLDCCGSVRRHPLVAGNGRLFFVRKNTHVNCVIGLRLRMTILSIVFVLPVFRFLGNSSNEIINELGLVWI